MDRVSYVLACGLLAAACGGGSSQRHTAEHPPLSVAEHEQHASAHDQAAAVEESQYRPEEGGSGPVCVDKAMVVPNPDSGGEEIPVAKPCWTNERNPTAAHLEKAEKQRRAARDHRSRARELVRAEREACQGLSEDDISRSPFYHSKDIERVEEMRTDGNLMGARVYFRKVPGLSVEWMTKATGCHQARAAVTGYNHKFMAYCPLMLPDVAVSVREQGGQVIVGLRSERDEMAAAALGRVQDLLTSTPTDQP